MFWASEVHIVLCSLPNKTLNKVGLLRLQSVGLHLFLEVSCYLIIQLRWFAFNGLLVVFHLTYKNANIP